MCTHSVRVSAFSLAWARNFSRDMESHDMTKIKNHREKLNLQVIIMETLISELKVALNKQIIRCVAVYSLNRENNKSDFIGWCHT